MVGAAGQATRGGRLPAVRVLLDGEDDPAGSAAGGLLERQLGPRLVARSEDRLDDLVMPRSPDTQRHGQLSRSNGPRPRGDATGEGSRAERRGPTWPPL
jgi:hypothetical protein